MAISRALISVSDKRSVVDLARALTDLGVEVVSSGGTARALDDAGVTVTPVSEVTGAPEMLDGRVKTLHPRIYAAILADRRNREHLEQLAEHGIVPIDLVVCNLYPFRETITSGASEDDAVEQIDVGGPAMVRAAAKNFHSVTVVVNPERYGDVVDQLRARGEISLEVRRSLAREAFAHTAAYDSAIAAYLAEDAELPDALTLSFEKLGDLRYGENPHQTAAFYATAGARAGLAGAEQLHGKELSYNNLMDADAAWRLVNELDDTAAVIIKHSNPCGAAVASVLDVAYQRALDCDRTSAFGGIVALNRPCDAPTAEAIVQIFTEVVLAPAFDDGALDALRQKKNLRVLRVSGEIPPEDDLRKVAGGMLVQSPDPADHADDAKIVTRAQPTEDQLRDLRFAWVVAKHVKSNAIVLAHAGQAVGVGAGQMSRVEATGLAARRAGSRARGAVCASDAFFPFRDGLDAAVDAGASAVIQPGGSVRDDEVIAAADEHGIPMLFAGRRHFRH